MSDLFSPFVLKDITLRNRIVVPPMCQYSAVDGLINDWHVSHYNTLARGGAGLVIVEATAVSPEGRITPGCLGLWNQPQTDALAQVAAGIKAAGAVAGIQIAHAGRKASANKPWEGDDHIAEADVSSWQPIAPSAVAYGENLPRVPQAMTLTDIERVKQDFVRSAQRALEAGFEWLELHFAHGYLAQSFYSVHGNTRDDQYGGDLAGRSRFMLETLAAVRQVWPQNLPLAIRFGAIEYDGNDEQMLAESIQVTKEFKTAGCDFISVSIGFNTPTANIPWGPAFLAPVAEKIRREAEIPVATAWGVDSPEIADTTVRDGQLDLVMVGRAHLANPHWPYKAALALNKDKPSWLLPAPYAHWLERYQPAN